MPHFVYADQNFLISSYDLPPEERLGKTSLACRAGFAFVLSPWSMVEIAQARPSTWANLAWFAESLAPRWLPDRRRLQQHEVEDRFFRYCGIPYSKPEPFRTLVEVMAELTRTAVPLGKHYNIVEFVQAIRSDLGPITQALRANSEARSTIKKTVKGNRLPRPVKNEVDRQYLQQLLPSLTPAGIAVGPEIHRGFLSQIDLNHFPSIAVETAMSEDALCFKTQLNKQGFFDVQHVTTALPYAEIIVTDDRKLTRAVERIAKRLPFPTAKLMTRSGFDALLAESVS